VKDHRILRIIGFVVCLPLTLGLLLLEAIRLDEQVHR